MRLQNLTLFAVTIIAIPSAQHLQAQVALNRSPEPFVEVVHTTRPKRAIENRYYYKHKLEYSMNVGYLPINIPFVFDCFVGDQYNMTPLKYTLVPTVMALRWQLTHIGGPSILRGNFDVIAALAYTAIPRGPETHYVAYDMGIRRNFIHGSGRATPYFDIRMGVGRIDAKGPLGVPFAQGQDTTFTFMMGSGLRYNINPRLSIEGGLNYMHVSNMYLSEPRFINYGINVYGPMFGINIALGGNRKDPH